MGNRQARAFVHREQDAADWDRARTVSRPAASDVHVRGIGLRRLQLIVCPPFGGDRAWEVRQRQEQWWLFASRVVAPWPAVQFVGYDPVPFDPAVLSSYFARIVALTLALSPDLSGWGGADGTISQLAVFGGLFSEWRFQWWSQSPPQWQPLVAIAGEMLAAFSAAEDV
jgi:hypothetical protein